MRLAVIALVAACTGAGDRDADAVDAAPNPDAAAAPAIVDNDGDRLDDAYETQLAHDYMPYVSLDPSDGCPLDGMVARVRPHPDDPTKILIVYSHLFERDCGFDGHIGDNEAFGIVIDPTRAAPGGILAIRAASHQNTPCERVTECSTCAGDSRPTCDLAADGGAMWPVLYASRGKHGQYASMGQCPLLGTCLDECTLAGARTRPPIVNVGEPTAPLVHDLTAEGFITAANGWTEPSLMSFDPWNASVDFGTAGCVADDLVDATFTPRVCD